MDTRILVTTYFCGHLNVCQESTTPATIWEGFKKQTSTQVDDFKYENSYHSCTECEEKKRDSQFARDPSNFLFLLPEQRCFPVEDKDRPVFQFNAPEPLIATSDVYSPYDIEINHIQDEIIVRELRKPRDLLYRPLEAERAKGALKVKEPDNEHNLPILESLQARNPVEAQSEHRKPEFRDSFTEQLLNPSVEETANIEYYWSRLQVGEIKLSLALPLDNHDAYSNSEDVGAHPGRSHPDNASSLHLIDPNSQLGTAILNRLRLYFSTPINLPASELLDFGTPSMFEGLRSLYQPFPPRWGVIEDKTGRVYGLKISPADLKLRETIIKDLEMIAWPDHESTSSQVSDCSDSSTDSSDEWDEEEDGILVSNGLAYKKQNVLISKETLPSRAQMALPHFPNIRGSSKLHQELKIVVR
jgi:hypothetical protein